MEGIISAILVLVLAQNALLAGIYKRQGTINGDIKILQHEIKALWRHVSTPHAKIVARQQEDESNG